MFLGLSILIANLIASVNVAPLATCRADERSVVELIINLSIAGYSGKN